MAWYSDAVDEEFPMCTDYTEYKYLNVCEGNSKKLSKERCGEEDICFKTFPADDPAKWRSDDFACRPLPERLIEGEFKYARRECKM
jgi:hypothetical protein